MTITDLQTCPGCGVAPNESHGAGCDHARCPECGKQLIQCDQHGDSLRLARWYGTDQQADVARVLGWWTTATGIDHLVEDYTRVLYADALGQIAWDPETQRYVIGKVDEAAINAAMSNG
jgi:hypothetical protein